LEPGFGSQSYHGSRPWNIASSDDGPGFDKAIEITQIFGPVQIRQPPGRKAQV
jgi:hypothetical protein